MTDFNDDALAFEHKLREHVMHIRACCIAVLEANGATYPSVDIRYNADDGGKWSICSYHKKIVTTIEGAELKGTYTAWASTLYHQNNIAVLRSLLSAPEVVVGSSAPG